MAGGSLYLRDGLGRAVSGATFSKSWSSPDLRQARWAGVGLVQVHLRQREGVPRCGWHQGGRAVEAVRSSWPDRRVSRASGTGAAKSVGEMGGQELVQCARAGPVGGWDPGAPPEWDGASTSPETKLRDRRAVHGESCPRPPSVPVCNWHRHRRRKACYGA